MPEILVLSIIIGYLRKGNLKNLAAIPFRHLYLFVIPLVMCFGVMLVKIAGYTEQLLPYAIAASAVQSLVLLAITATNLHVRYMWMIGLGIFSNFLAMTANGGLMPASEKAIMMAGLEEVFERAWIRHSLIGPETRLTWLTDIIPIPIPYARLSQVISIGDVLAALGIFLMIQWYMRNPSKSAGETVSIG